MKTRREWYFEQQNGRCYLAVQCRAQGAAMFFDLQYQRHHGYATWDHIYPRPREKHQDAVQLLACASCNHNRGRDPARAEHIALAHRLLEEWRAYDAANNLNVRGRKAKRKALRKAEKARRKAIRSIGLPETQLTPLERVVKPRGRSLAQEREFMQHVKATADKIDEAKRAKDLELSAKARSIFAALRSR